jgi:succinate-semialdehyde dehydrogenase
MLNISKKILRPDLVKFNFHIARNMASLLQNQAFINGKWTNSCDDNTFDVINPANLKCVGKVADCSKIDCSNAIEAASNAFYANPWHNSTAKERSTLLKKWFKLLEENKQEIAEIMTAESGKPISESLGEVMYGNSFVEWFAEEARRIYGEIVPSPVANRQIMMTRQAIGPVGLITPWNFPHAMITRKAAAALAAGKLSYLS